MLFIKNIKWVQFVGIWIYTYSKCLCCFEGIDCLHLQGGWICLRWMLKYTSDVPVKLQNKPNTVQSKIPGTSKQQLLWKPAYLCAVSRLTFPWRAWLSLCVIFDNSALSFFLWLSHDWHFVKNNSYVECMCAACVSLGPYLHALIKFSTKNMFVASR